MLKYDRTVFGALADSQTGKPKVDIEVRLFRGAEQILAVSRSRRRSRMETRRRFTRRARLARISSDERRHRVPEEGQASQRSSGVCQGGRGQDNCRLTVRLSVTTKASSMPGRVPEVWANDPNQDDRNISQVPCSARRTAIATGCRLTQFQIFPRADPMKAR